ncbi:MAG: hypothetical protein K2K53_00740 [Oscillospiraceae bacterium]|nr:hypothetical protein [Oscillospiraceae bacterium]
MEEMIPCAVKDREVFQRVWQRVMAGRNDAQCPVEALPPNMEGDLSCDCLEALARQQGTGFPQECERQPHQTVSEAPQPGWQPVEEPMPEEPMPDPMPEEPMGEQPVPEQPQAPVGPDTLPEADGPDRGNDLPQLWEEPQEATDRTARLRRQVMEALEGWQFYRHLARRARGTDARVLNSMAGEVHRHARKLSAAYFLLTGLRYWPSETLSAPAIPSYWGALRTRHQAEQRQENAYRMAADDWDDPSLLELYAELIEGCQHRGRQLRALLEQDVM